MSDSKGWKHTGIPNGITTGLDTRVGRGQLGRGHRSGGLRVVILVRAEGVGRRGHGREGLLVGRAGRHGSVPRAGGKRRCPLRCGPDGLLARLVDGEARPVHRVEAVLTIGKGHADASRQLQAVCTVSSHHGRLPLAVEQTDHLAVWGSIAGARQEGQQRSATEDQWCKADLASKGLGEG